MTNLIKIFILLLVSPSLMAMDLSFRTSRESGKLSFQSNKLVYITPQKSSFLPIKKCNRSIVEEFRDDIIKSIKEEKVKKNKLSRGSLFISGRTYYFNLDSKFYKAFDNFHDKMESLKTESVFKCMKEGKSVSD